MNDQIEQVLERLRKNPKHPVRANFNEMVVEIRLVRKERRIALFGDTIASLGPWSGESYDDLTGLISEYRKKGGSAEPPVF